MMSYTNLSNYYYTLFNLAQHHKYSMTEIEELVPFERDILVKIVMDYLKQMKDEQERRKREQQNVRPGHRR